MATDNKDFRVKNGLIVEGTTATVNGEDVLTTASNIEDLANVDTTGVEDSQALVYDLATGKWVPGDAVGGGGGGSYTISSTAPENPEPGDVWFDSTDGKSYIYFEDYDTSAQWVEIGSRQPGPEGPAGPPGGWTKEIRHDWNPPYDYIATAPEGTPESSTIWTITRIEVFADGTTSTTTATDSWVNRLTAVYS